MLHAEAPEEHMKHEPLIVAMLVAATSSAFAKPQTAPPAQAPAAAQPAPAPTAIAPLSEERRISADEIDKYLAEGKTLLLDVREPKELEELGTIEGAVNIPLGQLEKRLAEIPKDRVILTA
jgi:hypothetical protein